MDSPSYALIFYAISGVTILAGAVTAFSRNLVTAAFALFIALMGMSGLFILLGSDFLAVVQVVVYVGGILTLLLFGILLTNRNIGQVSGIEESADRTPSLILGLLLLGGLLIGLLSTDWFTITGPPEGTAATAWAPKISDIGALLLSRHLLAFELAGMLLLAALLGAAYLVRRRDV